MKSSLRRRLLITTVAVTLLLCGLIVTYTLETGFKREKLEVEKTITAVSIDAADKIKSKVDQEFSLIHAFARLDVITNNSYSEEEFEQHLDLQDKCRYFVPYFSQYPDKYENIAFYNTKGEAITTDGQLISVPDKPYVSVPCTTGKDYVMDPFYSAVINQYLMCLATPVENIGCMVTLLRGNIMDQIASDVDIGNNYHPVVINTKTEVLLTSKDIPKDKEKDYHKQIMAVVSKKGIQTYNDTITGEKMIAVSVPIEGYDWSLISEVPYKVYFGDINQIKLNVIIMAFLGISVLFFILFLLFRKSFKPLSHLDRSMVEIASGNADLTQRIENSSKDEVGNVVDGFNKFIEMLQNILKDITSTKNEMAKTYEALNVNVLTNKSNIEKSMSALMNATTEYTSMSQASETTASAMTQINANIDSLNRMIETQSSAITEASASIEEMIGNINSVSHSVEEMAKEFEVLSAATKMGIDKNTEVSTLLTKMQESSNVLLEANKAISGIASQTNLLAMNAAIEAAHAGAAGKGFAVVADEIRKLAEESAKQSKDIGNELKSVSEQIENVVGQAEISTESFKKVDEEITATTELVLQIKNAMEEQSEGSKQVLDALSDMNNSTSEVRIASEEMRNGSKQVNDLMSGLANSQLNLQKAFKDMDTQISNMQESSTSLNNLNKQVGDNVKDIEEKIEQFKI